jgi:hypothetical protein
MDSHYTMHRFSRSEVQRSRKKVIEISHFLDNQREQFEDLQTLLLNAMGSLVPSEEEPGVTKQWARSLAAGPQPPEQYGKDVPAADAVSLSGTSTVGTAADASSAVDSKTEGENLMSAEGTSNNMSALQQV